MNSLVEEALRLNKQLMEQNGGTETTEQRPLQPYEQVPPVESNTPSKIDVTRVFNGLKTCLPLIAASVCNSTDPEETLDFLLTKLRVLADEAALTSTAEAAKSGGSLKRTYLLRELLLKTVALAASQERYDIFEQGKALRLIERVTQEDGINIDNEATSPSSSPIGETNAILALSFSIHLSAAISDKDKYGKFVGICLAVTNEAFDRLNQHQITTSDISRLKSHLFEEINTLFRRVVEEECQFQSAQALVGKEMASSDVAHQIVERYRVILNNVINNTIVNARI